MARSGSGVLARLAPILLPSLLAGLVLFGPLPGLAAQAPKGRDLDDKDITRVIQSRLQRNDAIPAHRITVSTTRGIVTLAGSVGSLPAHDEAVRVARSVKGVRSVIDRIKVMPARRSDDQIRKDVEQALADDYITTRYKIAVLVKGGVVTLRGTARSWSERNLAARVAAGVRGVGAVVNDLKVLGEKNRTDRLIKADVERSLHRDAQVASAQIMVRVDAGKVYLSGTVGSLSERERATTIAGCAAFATLTAANWWWIAGGPARSCAAPTCTPNEWTGTSGRT